MNVGGKERLLDARILTYRDLAAVPVADNGEPLVAMTADLDSGIEVAELEYPFVRAGALERLKLAGRAVRKRNRRHTILVWCAYRSLTVQKNYFELQRAALKQEFPHLDEEALKEKVHLFVAVPEVAPHPTGGAFDLTIVCDGANLDMGTSYADFSSPLIHTFVEGLTEVERANRLILREAMMDAGFAPFNGEWWHFSYGDREWAAFYGESRAIYSQVETPSGNGLDTN
jgi:D-alanyl-D-alanine dipeptidase